jgi:hypothetical protein
MICSLSSLKAVQSLWQQWRDLDWCERLIERLSRRLTCGHANARQCGKTLPFLLRYLPSLTAQAQNVQQAVTRACKVLR